LQTPLIPIDAGNLEEEKKEEEEEITKRKRRSKTSTTATRLTMPTASANKYGSGQMNLRLRRHFLAKSRCREEMETRSGDNASEPTTNVKQLKQMKTPAAYEA
jgi:hypothetical protein